MPYVSQKVDFNAPINTSNVAGKTAIVTGGANGLGKAYVQALHAAGMHVYFGDTNIPDGEALARELPGTTFLPTDVTSYPSQHALFHLASTTSPSRSIHHIIANAGIAPPDPLFTPSSYPPSPTTPPSLRILETNLNAVLYTTHLALHAFASLNGTAGQGKEDTSLTLIGSGAAFLDCPRGPQYAAAKWAMRGLMHSLRRTAHFYNSRVNVLSPWYVRTSILPDSAYEHVAAAGVEFATAEDGGQLLLRIVSDSRIQGRQLFLAPRKWAASGGLDLGIDDFEGDEFLQQVQREQLLGAPVEEGLFLEGRW